ncbi:MAG: hypothetical protein HY822_04985 [Acidobacteria bacterium]|nr:hypothetical protein [Acidobacteriota bacterium]
MKRARWIAIDAAAIFVLTVILVGPWIRLKYLDNWWSIESTFIADARFLKENWPSPGWQPNWYCGTRYDYIYPPALRYGTAAISMALGVIPAKAYHIYTGIFYCLGIAGVYLLTRLGSGSRAAGWLAAAAAGTLSPAFLFLDTYRNEASTVHWLPQRLSVLVRYGEGPHMTAFAVLGLALAAAWFGVRKGRPAALALSAFLCALVVSNNFYGATALAMFFPVLVWAIWLGERDHRIWLRAAAIAALAYGLTALWLTPSYLRVTVENMRWVSQPGNRWSYAVALALIAIFAALSWRLGKGRPERAWAVFVWGSLLFFSVNVLGNHFVNFRVAGEPLRLVPELDLVMILASIEILRRLWRRRGRLPRAVAVVLVVAAFAQARHYVRHAWTPFVRDIYFDRRIEYRITDWMAKNMPESRALATGSVRFWYNTWHDLPQVGGGSEQGLMNTMVIPAQWQLTGAPEPEPSILWLQCLGAGVVLVHDQNSEEIYHDFVHPKKFEGKLEVLWDDRKGNRVYRVPRRWPARARVVDRARADALKPLPEPGLAALRAYVEVIEKGPDSPVELHRESATKIRLRARLSEGQSVLVQETFDPAWHAYAGGSPLAVRKDSMRFMLIDAPPGQHEIRLVFETPFENQAGRFLTAASGLVVLTLAGLGLRRRKEV